MADMATIAGAVSSLKAASDLARSLLVLRDGAQVQSKVIELQELILSAQSAALAAQGEQFELLNRIQQLEKQISKLEVWETEKRRYILKDYGGSTFAYALREDARGEEPDHRLCPTCFQEGRKSILQFDFRMSNGKEKWDCRPCGNSIELGQSHRR